MASFCGAIKTTMTDSELKELYGSGAGSNPGILSAANIENNKQAQGRDERGLLTKEAIQTAIQNIQQKGLLPTPPTASDAKSVAAYMKKDADFTNDIKKEYCFYDGRYRYALQHLIQALQSGYNDTNQSNQQVIQSYLQITQGLNQKLNDLAQIVNELTRVKLQQAQDQNSSLNALNQQLGTRSKLLSAQNDILQKEQGAANLYKEMVKYTKEKANYTNNMLALYSVLNITALGLLVYIYRSAAS